MVIRSVSHVNEWHFRWNYRNDAYAHGDILMIEIIDFIDREKLNTKALENEIANSRDR